MCEDLSVSISGGIVELAAADGIRVATDRAVPLGLVAIELITNTAKYAAADSESATSGPRPDPPS